MTDAKNEAACGASASNAGSGGFTEGVVVEHVTLLQSDLPKLVIAGQLSRRTSFQLRVDGFFDDKEQQALMQILTAQLEALVA